MKKSFTLIEVSISLVLLSLLLGGLFFFYGRFSTQKATLDALKWQAYEGRLFQQQVEKVLGSVEEPFFMTSDPTHMLFLFDRGVHENPLLSGVVLGELYYDPKLSSLRLTLWPKPNKEAPIKDLSENFLLLDRVIGASFEYYCPPDIDKKDIDPEKIGQIAPKEGWQTSWSSKFAKKPALVKISLTRKDKKDKDAIEYIFDLSSVILYPKEKIET